MSTSAPVTLAQTLSTGLKRKLTPTHVDGIPVSVLENSAKAPKDRPVVSPKRCQSQVSSYPPDSQLTTRRRRPLRPLPLPLPLLLQLQLR